MFNLLLVMLGGALGSGARFLVGRLTLALLGPNFPWGTLTVNIVGGFAMGALVGFLARFGGHEPTRLLLAVGLLGGFTTFSAFTLDMMNMVERGDWTVALGYAFASVFGALLALFAGLMLARALA